MSVAYSTPVVPSSAAPYTVVVAIPDSSNRTEISEHLRRSRWKVNAVSGGAEAIAALEAEAAEVLVLEDWLPDLEIGEFKTIVQEMFPSLEVVQLGEPAQNTRGRSPRRSELLQAIHSRLQNQPGLPRSTPEPVRPAPAPPTKPSASFAKTPAVAKAPAVAKPAAQEHGRTTAPVLPLPDIIGEGRAMTELARLVRLVAPRSTSVLIEGPTGSGKELVASAIHRLSPRAGKPLVTLNCAAIPESLLEAELFGHTRGAFTGAVQSRVGRVEAANGGTLFLDEIGEMPLALQAKMLRFLQNGEIQRIGGNETVRVDVRIVAATHQPLKQRAAENTFRLDLYHRLAVFPLFVPSLCDRLEDIPALAGFFLEKLGQEAPIKRLSREAEARLIEYDWPGNVRELAHVLERASILAEDRPEIRPDEIRF